VHAWPHQHKALGEHLSDAAQRAQVDFSTPIAKLAGIEKD
jgi:hypothetical protein